MVEQIKVTIISRDMTYSNGKIGIDKLTDFKNICFNQILSLIIL